MAAFICAAFRALGAEGEAFARRNLTVELGAAVAPLYAFRLYWRLSNFHPAPLGGANPAQVLAGRGIALGMLLAGIVLPLLFWAKEASAGNALMPFGLVLPAGAIAPHALLEPLFWLGVAAFLLGLLAHLFGVYTHHVVLEDESLVRLCGRRIEL